MWVAKGEKTRIRPLEREDVDKMQHWGRHRDPLFFHYNFPKMNKEESDEWYRIKTKKFAKKSFAVENMRGQVIGFMSIRDIKWIKKEAELGIVLDPSHIDQGYGADALKAFLGHYFWKLRMKKLLLRAAKFNTRAIRCYLNCGFRIKGVEDFLFEDQNSEIFYFPQYRYLQKYFTGSHQEKMTKYVQMEISKEDFIHNIEGLYTKKEKKCE